MTKINLKKGKRVDGLFCESIQECSGLVGIFQTEAEPHGKLNLAYYHSVKNDIISSFQPISKLCSGVVTGLSGVSCSYCGSKLIIGITNYKLDIQQAGYDPEEMTPVKDFYKVSKIINDEIEKIEKEAEEALMKFEKQEEENQEHYIYDVTFINGSSNSYKSKNSVLVNSHQEIFSEPGKVYINFENVLTLRLSKDEDR